MLFVAGYLLALRGGPIALKHEYGPCKPLLFLDAALAQESVATVSEDDDGMVGCRGVWKTAPKGGSVQAAVRAMAAEVCRGLA